MVLSRKDFNFYDILWFVLGSALLLGGFILGMKMLPEGIKAFLKVHKEYLSLLILLEQTIRIIPVILLTLMKKKNSFFQSLGFKKISLKELVLYPVMALIISWGILFLLQVLMKVAGVDAIPGLSGTQENLFTLFGNTSWSVYIIFFSAAFIAPVLEEITYRGFFQQIVMKYCSPAASILITALVFSLAHNELQVALPLFILGVILSTLYTKTGSILPGIVFHMLNNTISLLVLFHQ